jgi:hypothetical protein
MSLDISVPLKFSVRANANLDARQVTAVRAFEFARSVVGAIVHVKSAGGPTPSRKI